MTANNQTLFTIDAWILWFYWCLHLAGNYVATTWRAVGSLLHLDKANPLHGVLFLSANVILEGFEATPCCAATLGIRRLVGRRRHGSFLSYSCSARIVKLNSTFFASRRSFGGRTLNPLRMVLWRLLWVKVVLNWRTFAGLLKQVFVKNSSLLFPNTEPQSTSLILK